MNNDGTNFALVVLLLMTAWLFGNSFVVRLQYKAIRKQTDLLLDRSNYMINKINLIEEKLNDNHTS